MYSSAKGRRSVRISSFTQRGSKSTVKNMDWRSCASRRTERPTMCGPVGPMCSQWPAPPNVGSMVSTQSTPSSRDRCSTTRFGTPSVPPDSYTSNGLSAEPAGIRSSTGTVRSSSLRSGNFRRSANSLTSRRGSKPRLSFRFSQNGDPVSGLKCHWRVS